MAEENVCLFGGIRKAVLTEAFKRLKAKYGNGDFPSAEFGKTLKEVWTEKKKLAAETCGA